MDQFGIFTSYVDSQGTTQVSGQKDVSNIGSLLYTDLSPIDQWLYMDWIDVWSNLAGFTQALHYGVHCSL